MKRGKSRSQTTLKSQSRHSQRDEVILPPLDVLRVNVKNLRFADDDRRPHSVSVSFFEQLLFNDTTTPIGMKSSEDEESFYHYIIGGTISFDPSDYTKMCLFADCPLIVRMEPVDQPGSMPFVSCCNVDILPMFQGKTKMCISRRMEPLIEPTALQIKSWDNLPLITLELHLTRHPDNEVHHKILDAANIMRMTVIGAYNVIVPYEDTYTYVIASKIKSSDEENSGIVIYKQALPYSKRFSINRLYPKWESITWEDVFRKCEEKLSFSIDDIINNDNINLSRYLTNPDQQNTVAWGSFHRTLLLANEERLFAQHIQQYQWPVELHLFSESSAYSFMAFMDLFKLLYPGEMTVRLAVPVKWIDAAVMLEKCGCEPMLTANRTTASYTPAREVTPTEQGATPVPTGGDEGSAFLIVEVRLARPLVKASIPPHIPVSHIKNLLNEKEGVKNYANDKTVCTGRGQRNDEWHNTVKNAATSLRKVPYFGTTEFCTFNRQLSGTRVRVELFTSFWEDAAVYVNNNFVVQDFVGSDDTFEQLIMMAHPCLMREAVQSLTTEEESQNFTLRAARHARHLQDISHATDLYLQLVTENENNANSWRELATCLMDEDVDLAAACIDEALLLDPRHPLTLLSKGSMLFEKDPDSAELFFAAILALYPFWTTGWVAAEAFYIERQQFHVAEQIKKLTKETRSEGLAQDLAPERGWEKELGDWWYPTPLLPSTTLFFDAADLLLRLRGMPLAEACLGRALSEHGECPAYSHLVALACRLRGDIESALCHLQGALETFGEVNYLRSLEMDCLNKLKGREAALDSFDKAGTCTNAHSILSLLPCRDPQHTRTVVVDLLRRQPSAYAWMALAYDWLLRMTAAAQPGGAGDADAEEAMSACAVACAEQALKCDRRFARAWALLAQHVQPEARMAYCKDMASACGYDWSKERLEQSGSEQSICFRLGRALQECRCNICETSNKYDSAHLECECVKSVLI